MSNAVLETGSRSTSVRARVPEAIKSRWQSAASMRGQTLTDFLIVAANNAASETFLEHERIELSQRDQIKLAELLLNPPELTNIMKNALRERMAELKDSE
jgi:uncharacterized protein (DUF1778 family)